MSEGIKSRLGLDNSSFFVGIDKAVKKVDSLKGKVKEASSNVIKFSSQKAEKEISIKDNTSKTLNGINSSSKSTVKSVAADFKHSFSEVKSAAISATKVVAADFKNSFGEIKSAAKSTTKDVKRDLDNFKHLAVNPKVDFSSFKSIVDKQLKYSFSSFDIPVKANMSKMRNSVKNFYTSIEIPVKANMYQLRSSVKDFFGRGKNFTYEIRAKIENSSFVQKLSQMKSKATDTINFIKKKAYLKVAPMVVLKDMATTKINAVSKKIRSLFSKPLKSVVDIKDNISGKLSKIKGKLSALKAKITPSATIKDSITAKLATLKSKLTSIGKMSMKPTVFIKDNIAKVTSGLKGIASKLTSLPALAAVALTGLGVKDMLQQGMMLEKQEISIEHFMGIGNKDKDLDTIKKMSDEYVSYLRNNANITPFTTDEVMAAGTRSLTINGGDLIAAKGMLKIAEDMAALNPQKSLMDAMEALADLNVGETERMKEFGFKISQEDIKKNGMDQIMKDINAQFDGGAAKLSNSNAGLWSTITGQISSIKTDIGTKMLEGARPSLEKLSDWLTDNKDNIAEWANKVGDGFSKGVKFISDNFSKAKPLFDMFKSKIATISDKVSGVIGWFSEWKDRSGDTIDGIKSNISGLTGSFEGVIKEWTGLLDGFGVFWQAHGDGIMKTAGDTIDLVTGIIQTGLDLVGGIFKTVGDILRGDWDAVWEDIKGIAAKAWENITGIFDKAKELVSGIFDLFNGNSKKGKPQSAVNSNGTTSTTGSASSVRYKPLPPKIDGSYSVGINRLPDDQIAQVHKNEAIIPAKYNPWNPNNTLKKSPFANSNSIERQPVKIPAVSSSPITLQVGNIKIEIPIQKNGDIDYEKLQSNVTESVLKSLIRAVENMGRIKPA